VYEASQAVNIPVIGMGGISSGSDVVEFLLAGAAAVEVGTASYFDPCATEHIVDQLHRWCIEHRVRDVKELIGGLKVEA
jgi:dihydroorotate dehydrogenase (NAD+) catalytic subunit